jgi:acetate kinase
VLHMLQQQHLSAEAISHMLYRESGLLGLSGVSSDMRALEASSAPYAAMAIDYFVEHTLRELAAMAAALRGIDTLVFTGGIGENAVQLRQRVVLGAAWMGLTLDDQSNAAGARCISRCGSAVRVLVLRTDEETVIARHAAALAFGRQAA